jgi:hypothetical protein
MLLPSALFAWRAYACMSDISNRKTLIVLSFVNILGGLLISQFCADLGGISGIGIFMLMALYTINLPFLFEIYQSEADVDDSK